MARSVAFGLAATVLICASGGAMAQEAGRHQMRDADWRALDPGERVITERVAAQFFESELRLSQSRQIEAATATIYVSKSDEDRAAFREERRQQWRAMSGAERAALRGVKTPAYSNLAESQKAPFRDAALDRLQAPSQRAPQDGSASPSGSAI
ncbi:MAG: hypothetical protein ACX939_08630 [Hyphococcus sp.]